MMKKHLENEVTTTDRNKFLVLTFLTYHAWVEMKRKQNCAVSPSLLS